MKINAVNYCNNTNNYTNNTNFKARLPRPNIEELVRFGERAERYYFPRIYTLLQFLDEKYPDIKFAKIKMYKKQHKNPIYYTDIYIGNSTKDSTLINRNYNALMYEPYFALERACVENSNFAQNYDSNFCPMPRNVFGEKVYENIGKTKEDILELALNNTKRVVI